MKKFMFAFAMMLASISANAQFTIYQPAGVRHESYTPSDGYGVPFTIYEPIDMEGGYRQTAKPRMQQVTLTGYYKNSYG